jgi:DNA-directed RNA polymerase sigma subunit (sigma70/sigma32)
VKTTSPSDNPRLCRLYQAGDASTAEALLMSNSGLVAKIDCRYLPLAGSLEFDDLMQAGKLGLLNAGRRFDPERGTASSTHPTWWTGQAITSTKADTGSAIRTA